MNFILSIPPHQIETIFWQKKIRLLSWNEENVRILMVFNYNIYPIMERKWFLGSSEDHLESSMMKDGKIRKNQVTAIFSNGYNRRHPYLRPCSF